MQHIATAIQRGNIITTYDNSGIIIAQFVIPFNATLVGWTAYIVTVYSTDLKQRLLYDARGILKRTIL